MTTVRNAQGELPIADTNDTDKAPPSIEEIADKVNESINARREARRLLEEAKTMVEEAILGG